LELLLGQLERADVLERAERHRRVEILQALFCERARERRGVELERAIAGLHDRAVLRHPADRPLPHRRARHAQLDGLARLQAAGDEHAIDEVTTPRLLDPHALDGPLAAARCLAAAREQARDRRQDEPGHAAPPAAAATLTVAAPRATSTPGPSA